MKKNNSAETILAISGGLVVFYLIYKVDVLLFIALGFIAVGLLSSFLSSKIEWLWLGLSKILGYISSRIILSVVYFLVLTPLALLRRMLRQKKSFINSSNFHLREHVFSKSDFEKPF